MTLPERIAQEISGGYQDNEPFKRLLVSLHGQAFGLKPDGSPKICGTCPSRFRDAFYELSIYLRNMKKIEERHPTENKWKIKEQYQHDTISVPSLGFSLTPENLTDSVVEYALSQVPSLKEYFEKV